MVKRRDRSRTGPTSREVRAPWAATVGASRQDQSFVGGVRAAIWVQSASAFLFATLLIWAFVSPVDSVSVFLGEALPQNLFWLLAGVLCALTAASVSGISFGRGSILVCGVGLAWLVIVTLAAGLDNSPRQGWNGFWQICALASCYFCARILLSGDRSRAAIIGLLLVGSVGLSVYGLHQVSVGFPRDRARFAADPDRMLAEMQVDAPEGSPQRLRLEDRLNSKEPYATFALANSLGVLLTGAVILMIGASVAFVRNSSRDFGFWVRAIVLVAASLLVAICWMLTRSRAAYVGLLAGALCWLFQTLMTRRRIAWGSRVVRGSAVVVGVSFICGLLWIWRNDRLVLSEAAKSLSFRLEYWQATWAMIQEHWLFGVGLGNFQSYYPQYKLEVASEEIADPHNWLLDLAATLSVPLMLLTVVWLSRNLLARTSSASSPASDAEGSRKRMDLTDLDRRDAATRTWVVLGAVVGGCICLLLTALLSGIDTEAVFFAWLIAVVFGVACWPAFSVFAIRDVRIYKSAAVAMLTCLMASGSWQASGIAVPLMIVLAASEAVSEVASVAGGDRSRLTSHGRYAFLLPLLGLTIFIFQAWQPVTSSWGKLQEAQSAADLRQRLDATSAAIQADPLDVQSMFWLAQIKVQQATVASSSGFEIQARDAIDIYDQALAKDKNRFTNWQLAGEQALTLCDRANRQRLATDWLLEKAIYYYRNACERYPTSVRLRAQLAVVAAYGGQWDVFQAESDEAMRLSQVTPHDDKKLGNQLVWLPFRSVPAAFKVGEMGSVRAELVLDWLRRTDQLPVLLN